MTTSNQAVPSSRAATAGISWFWRRFVQSFRWFLPIILMTYGTLTLIINRFGGAMENSLWHGFAANAPYWFLFAIAVNLVWQYFVPYLANGGTRATFVTAAISTVVLAAALLALTVPILGYLIEGYLYGLLGWNQSIGSWHLFGSPVDYFPMVVEYGLRYTLLGLAGVLVGAAYYRFRSFGGTILLPLTVVTPMLVAELIAFDPNTPPAQWLGVAQWSVALRLVIAIGTAAVLAFGTHVVLRGAAVRPKKV